MVFGGFCALGALDAAQPTRGSFKLAVQMLEVLPDAKADAAAEAVLGQMQLLLGLTSTRVHVGWQ